MARLRIDSTSPSAPTATPGRPGETVKHWTISRYHAFVKCPYRYYLQYVEKRPTGPPGEALERGIRIHSQLEAFFNGGDLPRTASAFAEVYEGLRARKPIAEQAWRFNERWRPVKDGGWLVMKTDLHLRTKSEALIVDFKTGKVYDTNVEQMEVYACGAFAKWPKLERVVVELHYIDQKEIKEGEYDREKGKALRVKWDELGRNLLAATEFPARPGYLCNWCPYANGKPCRDGVSDRG
jgi:RecB family exonuclease